MKLFRHRLTSLLLASWALLSGVSQAETGVTDSTITLGMSAPFSGPNGIYGTEMRESITAYFEQINKSGGINGRKLELVSLDDGYETEKAVANTRKLINEEKAFALLAFYGSSPTTAAMEVFTSAKVPLVGTISGAETLRNPVNRYMFNVRASYANETDAIISQLASLGLKNIAVFYQNDGFGKSGLEGVTTALKKHGLTPSAVGTVERNSLEVGKAVEAIAKVTPQAVIMVTLYKPTAEFVRQMRKAGQNPQFMTLSPVGADLLVKELGNDARGIGISQVMPYPWNDSNPLVREYRKLMTTMGKQSQSPYYSVEGYAMAKVMVEAIKRAGKDLTREKLVTALEGMGSYDLGGYRISYSSSDHNGSRFVDLTVIGSGGRVLR
ncbi:MAG TPA: ABC transporter substrate-binding protein [Azospira sp.]|nr:ABC transporter substrate-binding protein [Azospira sp.]